LEKYGVEWVLVKKESELAEFLGEPTLWETAFENEKTKLLRNTK